MMHIIHSETTQQRSVGLVSDEIKDREKDPEETVLNVISVCLKNFKIGLVGFFKKLLLLVAEKGF